MYSYSINTNYKGWEGNEINGPVERPRRNGRIILKRFFMKQNGRRGQDLSAFGFHEVRKNFLTGLGTMIF
jgi:hypothetical protein